MKLQGGPFFWCGFGNILSLKRVTVSSSCLQPHILWCTVLCMTQRVTSLTIRVFQQQHCQTGWQSRRRNYKSLRVALEYCKKITRSVLFMFLIFASVWTPGCTFKAVHNAGFVGKQSCRPPRLLGINHCSAGSHEFSFTSSSFLFFSPITHQFPGRSDTVINSSLDVKSFLLNTVGRRMAWKVRLPK